MGRPRPSLAEFQRQKFRARQILAWFCQRHGIEPNNLLQRNSGKRINDLRHIYIVEAYAADCGITAIAKVAKRGCSTVDYHVRATRKVWHQHELELAAHLSTGGAEPSFQGSVGNG